MDAVTQKFQFIKFLCFQHTVSEQRVLPFTEISSKL